MRLKTPLQAFRARSSRKRRKRCARQELVTPAPSKKGIDVPDWMKSVLLSGVRAEMAIAAVEGEGAEVEVGEVATKTGLATEVGVPEEGCVS